MLSVGRPSGRPSCSSSPQDSPTLRSNTEGVAASPTEAQTTDPAGRDLSQRLPPPPSRFSIRDYVLSSRRKDVKKNWPFHVKFLRCLLKHDIHDLLPPFEPPDLVRIGCSEESLTALTSCIGHRDSRLESDLGRKGTDDLVDAESNRHKNASNSHSNLLILEPSVHLEKSLSDDGKLNDHQGCIPHSISDPRYRKTSTESTVTCNTDSEQRNPTSKPSCSLPSLGKTRISKYPVEAELARAPVQEKQASSKEPAAKKCKLVLKSSATLDTKRGEEVSINSGTVSDSMASKVCPVCKTFSSTSNTTLNAHIDQCLSMEPEANCITDATIKHKVKPTKKRLMVDIYSTAPRCTLEDLDKRNGTNWATDSTLTIPSHDAPTDNKKGRCSLGDQISNPTEKGFIEDHATDTQDGAVTFDANGTKICILSKLNTVSPVKEAEVTKSRKLTKEAKKQMRFTCSKGGHLIPRNAKSVKLKAEGKKFCSLKSLKDEVLVTSTCNDCPMDGERDESQQLQKASQMKTKPNEPRLATQQAFSKCSRNAVKDVRSPSSSVQDSLAPSSQSIPSVSVKNRSLAFKISPHADGSITSSKVTSSKMLLDLQPNQDLRQKKSQFLAETGLHYSMGGSPSRSGLRPRLSRRSGNCNYARSKKKKLLSQKSGKLARLCTMSSENWCQTQGNKTLGKSLPPVDKCKGKNLRMLSKSMGKHRSLKESHQKRKKQTSIAENVFNQYHCKEMVIADSVDLENFIDTRTGSLINHLSCGQSNFAESQLEMGDVYMNGRKDDSRSYFEGASSESQVVNLGYQTRCLTDVGTTEKSYMENIGDPQGRIEPAQCSGPMATSNSSLESWSRLVENVNFIGGKESLGEPLAPRTFNHEMVHSETNTSNVDVITSMEMGCQQDFKSLVNSCSGVPYMECRMNTAQDPGLSDYATSSTNDGTEVPQGNSSVTSNKITYNDGHNVVVDSAASDTPESGASIISDPVDESNREDSVRPVVVEGESISGVSDVLPSSSLRNACDSRGEDTEKYKMADASTAPKPGYWGGQGACSDKEIFNPGVPRQCNSAEQVFAMTERQLASVSRSNLQLRDNISSCSHELAVTVSSSSLVARSPHVEENMERPPCSDFKLTDQNAELEPQFPANPVFRLMGKNLLVPRKEGEHVDGGKTDCSHKSTCNVRHPFHPPSSPHNYVMNPRSYDSHSLQHQLPEKWRDMVQLPSHPPNSPHADSFGTYRFQNMHRAAECNQTYQSWPCPENLHSLAYHGERPAHPCQYQKCMTSPVIIIDDSQQSEAEVSLPPNPASTLCSTVAASNSQQAKRLSCNPAHYAVEMREMTPIQLRPGLYCSYARSGGGGVQSGIGWNSSVASSPPNPPFVVPSIPSSKLTHSLYYFPSMR